MYGPRHSASSMFVYVVIIKYSIRVVTLPNSSSSSFRFQGTSSDAPCEPVAGPPPPDPPSSPVRQGTTTDDGSGSRYGHMPGHCEEGE